MLVCLRFLGHLLHHQLVKKEGNCKKKENNHLANWVSELLQIDHLVDTVVGEMDEPI